LLSSLCVVSKSILNDTDKRLTYSVGLQGIN